MKTGQHARSSNSSAPPSAEARSAFDQIVSDIVAGPLNEVRGELRDLAKEFREADEEALEELKGSTRRALADCIGNPGVGPAATLFELIGDPDDPEEGTLASQLDRISHEVRDTAAASTQEHARMEALISDLRSAQSHALDQLSTRQLAQQSANALSAKIHVLTILVILQGVGLTALMLVR